jgi:hypothetical protein
VSLRQPATRHPVTAAVACAGAQFLLTVLILKAGMRAVALKLTERAVNVFELGIAVFVIARYRAAMPRAG